MAKMLVLLFCMIILQGVTPLKKMQTLASQALSRTNNYLGVMDSEKKYFLEIRDGVPVMTSKPKGNNQWTFVTSGSYIYLKNQETGEVLQGTKNNTVKLASKSNMASKLWSISYYTKTKQYAFINKYYNTAIDFNGGDYGEGNPIILTPFNKEKSQLLEILQPDQIEQILKEIEEEEKEEGPKEIEPENYYYISACTDATCTEIAFNLYMETLHLRHTLLKPSDRFLLKRDGEEGKYAILLNKNFPLIKEDIGDKKIFFIRQKAKYDIGYIPYIWEIIKQGKNSYIIKLEGKNVCVNPGQKTEYYFCDGNVTYYKFEKAQ